MLGSLGGSGIPGGDSAKSISFLEVGSFSKVNFFFEKLFLFGLQVY